MRNNNNIVVLILTMWWYVAIMLLVRWEDTPARSQHQRKSKQHASPDVVLILVGDARRKELVLLVRPTSGSNAAK